MAQLSPEQQKAIEQQKANCPFCKIIKGEYPSKKVYEDDRILAVLDINPAHKGHTLVVPKEHYPILPLVPPETFEHLTKMIRELSGCVKKGALVFGTNVFVANGVAAGQQSQHFIMHIIPRENGDGISVFDVKAKTQDEEKTAEAFRIISNNLPIMMKNRYVKYPLKNQPVPSAFNKEKIMEIIEQNPSLKNMILHDTDRFKEMIQKNPQLNEVFGSANVEDIISEVKTKQDISDKEKAEKENQQDTVDNSEEFEQESQNSDEKLLNTIKENPKLKTMLLHDFPLFKQKVAEIPQLQKMFEGFNLESIKKKLEELEEESIRGTSKEKKKLDLISRLLS